MSESDSERQSAPAQQAQQPQPPDSSSQSTARITGLAAPEGQEAESLNTAQSPTNTAQSGGNDLGPSEIEGGKSEEDDDATAIDAARVTARIKGLYKELLEAPIPDEWMRLVNAIESKERK